MFAGGEQGAISLTIKDKILIYIYRKNCFLEQQKKDFDYQRRHMPLDSLELYEAMRQDIEIQCWNEFVDELYRIVLNCR